MVNYLQTPAGLAETGAILQAMMYVSIGCFLADSISSFPFDWSIISGKREVRWMHTFYFGAKASLITFLIQNLVTVWMKKEYNCHGIMQGLEFIMGICVIFSSILLSFRTIVVNNINGTKVPVKSILAVAGLCLIAAWMQGVTDVTAIWSTEAATLYNEGFCFPIHVKETYYVKYIVTIAFDFLVLALAIRGILLMDSRSRFGDILIRQGIIYFVLSLLANVVITILTLLKISPLMSLLVAVPQSTICIIASTRLYSQLAMQNMNTTHVPTTRTSSMIDSDLSRKPKISEIMTMEEGLQIQVHVEKTQVRSM